MEYVHTHERDSFYELPPSQLHTLPEVLREHLANQRFKTKVRVTTDQKTGRVLNKIVKARIADCNVYSPMTRFDWRVSVNMEMPWTGDIEGLVAMAGADVSGGVGGGEGVRMKDRMSYRHLAYQIDLTQVTDVSFTLCGEIDGWIRWLTGVHRGPNSLRRNTNSRLKSPVKKFGNMDNWRIRGNQVPTNR